jgi:anti-sigma-K factor RskA
VTQNCFWRGVLIVALSVVLATPAKAQSGKIVNTGPIVAAIVGVAAALVVVTVVVIHESSKKRTITGCVNSEENGMSVTDEKDKRIYALSGDTAGVKPGDRITLQGKKVKPKGSDKTLVWEAKRVTKDFGACQP